MEASEKGTKLKRDDVTSAKYGQCRGCLAVGRHRDVMKEYYHDGNPEVYCDIFYECFNIFMSTNEDISTLICSKCIQKLRDAYNFKMTVLASEQKLLSLNKQPVFINVPYSAMGVEVAIKEELAQIKQEVSDAEVEADNDCDMETDNADFDSDYIPDNLAEDNDLNADIKDITISDDYKVKEEKFLARFGPGEIQLLPTKASLYEKCSNYFRHLQKLKGRIINSKLIPQILRENTYTPYRQSTPRTRTSDISEKYAYIYNAAAILEYSNVTPFKSKKHAGFPCFYCKVVFAKVDKLREHQTLEHKKSEIKDALSLYGAEVLVINVDVTNLKCEICDESMPNLNEFKTHLVKVHKKELYPEQTNRIIPFKLSETNVYECQVCGFNFVTFGAIERHMNVHFRNYVCTICGTGFVTNYRLKVHVKGMHDMGSYPCEVCNKVFKTQQKYKMHYTTVHNSTKRFRCAECPERFTEYFRRQKHMVEVHGFAPIKYKCNVCDRSFDRRYNLSRHQKRDHLEERDFKCEICAYQCFSNNELRFHMIKHNGERIHECSVCKKSYARKKTLREHMRIHNNDRRFSCAVCGQAFVQKCSLKGHIKTHHLEYSMQ